MRSSGMTTQPHNTQTAAGALNTSNAVDFPVWKTLKLDGSKGLNLYPYIEKINRAGMSVSIEAELAIKNHRTWGVEEKNLPEAPDDVDLVKVSAGQLFPSYRFNNPYAYLPPDGKELWKKMKEVGLEYCPTNTVALLLRIDYKDQPEGERLIIMSSGFNYVYSYLGDTGKPFSYGSAIFALRNTNGLLVLGIESAEYGRCDETDIFVFVKPRKQETAE